MMMSASDLLELAQNLKQEQLFVSSEKKNIQSLFEKVASLIEEIYHVSWISRQQRIILDNLILNHAEYSPSVCCQKSNAFETVKFYDSRKQLSFHDSIYGKFLLDLRTHPKLLAAALCSAEKLGLNIHRMVHIIFLSVYGNCILHEDELYILKLLKSLIENQLSCSNNPCRMLRQGSCAFSKVYKIFSEGLFSAKIFLTAALHEPILHLLMEGDMFLDIDPGKAVVRFSPEDRLKKFGIEGSEEYARNLHKYREWTIGKLVNFTNRFITSIKQSMYCFPSCLSWLIKQVYETIIRAGNVDQREVSAMCTDLLFSFFICPAIVNPEPYSITTDTPINYIALFNLMQVAQILQVLAMSKLEEIDPKLMDLYGKFDKDCMSSLLDLILKGNEELNTNSSSLPGLTRSAVLIEESSLMILINDLKEIQERSNYSNLDVDLLSSLLSPLPSKTVENEGGASKNIHQPATPNTMKKNTLTRGLVNIKSNKKLGQIGQDHDVDANHNSHETVEDVLVVPISFDGNVCPGMLSVDQVLKEYGRHNFSKLNISSNYSFDRDGISGGLETQEKRTRFSLSHDQDSIGNTSDNLEAISEVASNHSMNSSIELENEENDNDNFSDMVSANVSGRGTPNVSGRDTPSSQIEEDQNQPLNLPVTAQKQNREDINDKFGKFEIKQLSGGDETISMVSDTWSTDVLASDSENVEQADASGHANVSQMVDPPTGASPYLDISETASDAWSTDVITSDTDRLQDIDTDDTGSINTARSDDTSRSEVEGDVFAVPSSSNMGVPSPADFQPTGIASQLCLKPNAYGMEDKGSEGHSFDLRRKHPSNSSRASSTSADVPSSPKFQILSSNSYERSNDGFRMDTSKLKKIHSNFGESQEGSAFIPICSRKDQMQVPHTSSEGNMQYSANQRLFPSSLSAVDRMLDSSGKQSDTMEASRMNSVETMDLIQLRDNRLFDDQACNLQPHKSDLSSFDPLLETELPCSTQRLRRDFADIRLSTASSGSNTSVGDISKSSGSASSAAFISDGATASSLGMPPLSQIVSSSGTIPKTENFEEIISDDKDLENFDKGIRDKDKKSFFKNLKDTFKSKSKKIRHSGRDESSSMAVDSAEDHSSNIGGGMYNEGYSEPTNEIGEDILAKYRKKFKSEDVVMPLIDHSEPKHIDCLEGNSVSASVFDNRNPEMSFIFKDTKRKLRLVLSSADISMLPSLSRSLGKMMHQSMFRDSNNSCDNEFIVFLNIVLAEATNLEQRSLVAQLHEALRCVSSFDKNGCKKLYKSLREDYKKRSPYISYLIKSRQGLLSSIAHLQRTVDRIQRDKTVCNKFMISKCVRIFLADKDHLIKIFIKEFQKLTVPDEKTEYVEIFLQNMYDEIRSNPFWKGISDDQIEMAEQIIERDIMDQIYWHALYPNNEGDIHRDQVFHKHMKRLSEVITPNHDYINIPAKYQYECPWPSAQAEIITINAYKTPKDKLRCVVRCCKTIMNLLSIISDKSVPAADDFMPVILYVLIKANPSSLLSTIQYVDSFYGKRLNGEESYWWAQFVSAIEFIKTMTY